MSTDSRSIFVGIEQVFMVKTDEGVVFSAGLKIYFAELMGSQWSLQQNPDHARLVREGRRI